MIGQINRIAEIWWNWMGPMFWQVSLLIVFLGVVDYGLRRHLWPQIRHAMWLLVLVKLLLPPTFALPTGLVSRLHPSTDRPLVTQYDGSAAPYALSSEEGFDRQGRGRGGPAEPREDPASLESAAATGPGIATASAASAPLSWEAVAMAGWLAGVLMLTVWLAAGYARLSRRHAGQGGQGHVPESFTRLLAATAQKLGLRRLPRVVVSQSVASPAVFGLFRPVLLLPAEGIEGLSPREAEHILLHELAHLKRSDLQVHALCVALQVIYWFNPLLYLVRRQLQHLRELCCDATVAAILKGGTRDYCQTLLETAERLLRGPSTRGIGFLGLVENPSRLLARLRWLQKGPSRHPRLRRASAILVGGLLFAVLLPMAQAKKSASSPAKAGSVDSPSTVFASASFPSEPTPQPEDKTVSAATKDVPATGSATGAEVIEQAPSAVENDTIVDPNTGVKFTVAKRISAENDTIIHNNELHLSPNGKFLLWQGTVTPLDGGKPFELDGVGRSAAWSPDGKLIAYRSGLAIWLLPVAPETGQATGPARKLVDDQANWSDGVILWSADSEWIILRYYEQGDRRYTERCISVRDGKLTRPPEYTHFSLRSPDQKTLAYCRPSSGVWAAPVGSGATRLVAGNFGKATLPLWWSPDGQWLLCGGIGRWYSYDVLSFVRLADRREVALRFPEQVGDVGFRAYGLGVSPDGRKLQFFKNSHDLRTVTKVAPMRGGGFAELPFSRQFDSIDIEQVRAPEDGGLVFIGDKQNKEAVYVAPARGGDPVEVKLNVSLDGAPLSWQVSPDGKRVLAIKYTRQGSEWVGDFYVIPISLEKAQSTGPATLIFKGWQHPKGGVGRIAWSPDSSRLAIPAKGESGGELWVVPADGSEPKRLTQSPEEVEQSPTWSPDGKFIAYCVKAAAGVGVSLYAIPADGGIARRLWTWTKPAGRGEQRYAWFPDSREIGVVSDDGVVAVATPDGSVRPFLKLAEARLTWLWWLQWSPDGQTLALFGGDDDSYQTALFRASDRKTELLPPDPTWKVALGWTGDSQALFCVAQQPERIRPAALVYDVDLVEAWTQAKNSAAGVSSPASASPMAKLEAPPLVNGEFRDDFEDGDTKDWTFDDMEWQGPGRVREVRNGELVLENTRAVLGLPEWTNYVVTVKMCIKQVLPTSRGGGSAAGIGFRKGEHGEYWLGAEPDRKDLGQEKELELVVIYRDADKRVRVGELAAPPYNFVVDKWYTLQVEVKGPHIVARVDGQTIIDLNDESCPHGAVALFSVEALAHFDDFSVRLLP